MYNITPWQKLTLVLIKRDVHEQKLKSNLLDEKSMVKETKIERPLLMYFYTEFVNELRDRRCQ